MVVQIFKNLGPPERRPPNYPEFLGTEPSSTGAVILEKMLPHCLKKEVWLAGAK
jgi:hypothetical protein